MGKTMSRAFVAAAVIAAAYGFGSGPAGAMTGTALTRALADDGLVQVSQQRRAKKARSGQQLKISDEHKQRIRETVPREYHQYLPKSITGGGHGAAGGM